MHPTLISLEVGKIHGAVVKLQYCSQGFAHDLSLILTGPDRSLRVESAFHPSEVGKLST